MLSGLVIGTGAIMAVNGYVTIGVIRNASETLIYQRFNCEEGGHKMADESN